MPYQMVLADGSDGEQPRAKRARGMTIYGSDDDNAPEHIRDQSMSALCGQMDAVEVDGSPTVATDSRKRKRLRGRKANRADARGRQRTFAAKTVGSHGDVNERPTGSDFKDSSAARATNDAGDDARLLFSPKPTSATGAFLFIGTSSPTEQQ